MSKTIMTVAAGAFLVIGVGWYGFWHWGVCHQGVRVGESLVVYRKTGRVSAKDSYAEGRQKGVQRAMLGPGRHFRNPWDYNLQRVEDVIVKPGEIRLVNNNIGDDLPPGQFIADEHQKGTLRRVLTPGCWRINTFGQEVSDPESATIIEPGYAGVVTLREGPGKGVLDTVLTPGYYNINLKLYRVDVVEIGYRDYSINVELTRDGTVAPNTGVSFPLADGKQMQLDFTVVWGVWPENAPRIIRDYGSIEMVEEKIIEPQVLSLCKNYGSNLTTQMFIEGESREEFQTDVTTALEAIGKQKGIDFLIALVRGFHPDPEIRGAIQAKNLAEEEKKTLAIEEQRDRVAAARQAAEKVVEIAIRDFDGETRALVEAERELGLKEAAEVEAEADRQAATLRKEAAQFDAEAERISGDADAEVTEAMKKAEATKYKYEIEAYGDPRVYNLAQFARELPDDVEVSYRYYGDGTFITDGGGDVWQKKLVQLLLQRNDTPAAAKQPKRGSSR